MTIHEYIWISLGLFGSLWVSLSLFGSPWVSVVLLGTPSLLTQESLWVSFGLFWIFGSPVVSLDLLGSLWIPLKPLILFFRVPLVTLLKLI